MLNHTVKALSQLLSTGKTSATELAQDYLAAIKQHNGQLNAYTVLNEEKTLQVAQQIDEKRVQVAMGPLAGIPLALKDIFCHEGWKSSCASKMLDNFVAPYTATVVQKLEAAGMVVLGRTNMDEFAMGSSNETSYQGPTRNPWNTEHVPGGSSGGSAAVVAARLAPAALGSDTGGSIRQPASHCGITGLKPTYGTVSRYGMIAYASSFDQAGPMAQTAEDCALLLNAMAGFDTFDSTSLKRETEDFTRYLHQPLKGLKIGLVKEYFGDGLDAPITQAIDQMIALLKAQGIEFVDVSLPNTQLAIPAYYVLASAEAATNLSRYDGVRYGYRTENFSNLKEMYSKSRAQGFGSEVKRRIMIGTYVLSHGYYDAYYLKAAKLRRMVANDFQAAFQQCDLILGPVAPTVAPKIASENTDPLQMYLSDIYTIAANLAGLPAMSLPCGFHAGLPAGVQLIGSHFSEAKLLNCAHQIQLHSDWHAQSPALCV